MHKEASELGIKSIAKASLSNCRGSLLWLIKSAYRRMLLTLTGSLPKCAAGSGESDAAVGAFVQLIQDAPPLQRSIMPANQPGPQEPSQEKQDELTGSLASPMALQEMTVQEGLDQLAKLRLHLNQHT